MAIAFALWVLCTCFAFAKRYKETHRVIYLLGLLGMGVVMGFATYGWLQYQQEQLDPKAIVNSMRFASRVVKKL